MVRSVGPSAKAFPPGKSLPENSKITLKANDSLIVLDGRGTRTLRGPGTFAPGTRTQATSRTGLSPLTGAGQQAGPDRRGAQCRFGAAQPEHLACRHRQELDGLRRWHWSGPAVAGRLGGAGHDHGQPAGCSSPQTIELAAGEAIAAWPQGLPIADGASYQLSWPGAPAPTALKFETLPPGPVGLEEMASSLIQHGCEAQLDLLIETFRAPDDVEPTTVEPSDRI